MDQSEDREEGVPPSETTLCGEHESKAQREAAGVQQLKDLRKYSCQLTIDTNTVNRKLQLSEDNRKVTWMEELQSYPDHPDRFDDPQLLCSDGLTGRCYWEVEWRGDVYVSVSYRRIRRKGDSKNCWFGYNDQSWSLSCSDDGYSVWHNNRVTFISSSSSSSSSISNRVAVYVDCPAGILSFYRVSSDSLIHLHTFNTTFTEPLYPGFWIRSGSSVFLCSLPRSEPLATSGLSPSREPDGVQQLKDLRKYSCQLTIDTNTVSRNLQLSEDNRKVTCVKKLQSYPDHPERLGGPQLLCSDGLTGRCYWEVEWRGGVDISVSYRRIRRKEGNYECWFGFNDQSWSLRCSDSGYYVCHNMKNTFISSSSSVPKRVAVYVDCPAGILSFYRVSSDSLIHLHTFNTTFTEPLYPGFWIGFGSSVFLCSLPRSEPLATSGLSPSSNVGGTAEASKDQTRDTEAETSETSELKESSSSFTPEMKTEYSRVSYRFKFPGPGVFQCTLTRLVFVMTQAAEVLYRTVVWPDGLLESAGKKTPAGMLFNIKCSEGAISQLHLPHCETNEALCFNRFLSVAHITDDDGMSILEPTKITDTHVLVNVPHLSAFGLIWDTILRFFCMKQPINCQVLLFLRPPGRVPPTLDVLLLLGNIPLSEVSAQHEESEHIKVSSECLLTADQSYSVRCEPQALIDPKSKTFRMGCGPNFHPTFVVCMTTNPERVTLVLQDQHCTAVWEHGLYIPSPSSRKISADGTLEKTKSLKKKLFNILKDLKDENFREFKWYLGLESLDGSSPIQKAELENAERQDVVDLVVHHFGFEGALKVTVKVLKDIGMNNLAEELQNSRFH